MNDWRLVTFALSAPYKHSYLLTTVYRWCYGTGPVVVDVPGGELVQLAVAHVSARVAGHLTPRTAVG